MSKQSKSKSIIIDLTKKNIEESVDDSSDELSAENKEKMSKLTEEIKKELGIVDEEEPSAETVEPPKENPEQTEDANKDSSYEKFIEQISKKEENLDISSYGKYNSDIDFKINRKLKKIRLPLPKKAKMAISSLAVGLVIVLFIAVGVALYQKPQEVVLQRVYLSQNVVSGVYVGDEINYSNLYVYSEYSDGSVRRTPITSSMVKSSSNGLQNGKFVESGDVEVNVSHLGNNLKLVYSVETRSITKLSLFGATQCATERKLALSDNNLVVIAEYDNGTSSFINLSSCTYKIDGGAEQHLSGGKLDLDSLLNGTHTLEVLYNGVSATTNFEVQIAL